MSEEIAVRYGIRRAIQALLVALLLSNCLLAAKVLLQKDRNRETLVPPQIQKPFWVDDHGLDPNYLDQMAGYLLQLRWNRTPQSCDGNAELLLRYVGAGSLGEMQRTLAADCAKLRELNASQVFTTRGVSFPAGDGKSVVFSGTLSTYIADRRTSELTKHFWLRFGNSGGTLYLDSLREVAAEKDAKDTTEGTKS